jgi:hypothetical protein
MIWNSNKLGDGNDGFSENKRVEGDELPSETTGSVNLTLNYTTP